MNPYDMTMESACPPCAGFDDGRQEDMPGRVRPVCVRMPVSSGRYRLTVRIAAARDAAEALLFSSHRRLIWRGALKAGGTVCVSAMVMAHPVWREGADEPDACTDIELALLAPGAQIVSVSAEKADAPAVLLMGDSTVTDQRSPTPYAPGASYCGWGQLTPLFLGERACVGNFARSGLTVETFRTEGLYDLMKAQLRSGDVVLMQFGHNDQKRMHLAADGGYAQALRTYIEEIRSMGGVPVAVTPLARNSWKNEAQYMDLLEPFAKAAIRAAQETGAPVIDLHGCSRAWLEETGRDAAKAYFHIGDYTHTNDFGAYLAAGFVAGELARLGLMETQRCAPWPPHGPYDVPAVHQGDESLTPDALKALYRAYETDRPDAPLTRQEALELVCRTCGLFAHNAPVSLPADVPQDEPFTGDIRCAMQHGIVPADMLADGKFHRHRRITAEEFMRVLAAAYGMRCRTDALPAVHGETITRAQAAVICRSATI